MFVDIDRHGVFRLDDAFVEGYRDRPVPWGFGALSWVTYKRTYSRDGEDWWQTCRRVIEGMMTVERVHCREHGLVWDEAEAQGLARDAYERLWRFQWTPPGRGLWIMGTPFLYERGGAALNNCGFVSTKDLAHGYAAPFLWVFEMSMLGVGVGFDTRGAGTCTVRQPAVTEETHVVEDSREGWAGALRRLLEAYAGKGTLPAGWDFSRIRPSGVPLRGFGGVAAGPAPLRKMLERLSTLYDSYVERRADSRLIVDTMNLIGACVVAGGIRRSAQIAFGDPKDTAFLDLKQDAEKLREYRWVSNNSVFATAGMDYRETARRTVVNGEPGYMWLQNARAYGRLQDPPSWLDESAEGSNPCVEQTLWDRELCCLVETFPARHDDLADYERTLRVAYRYAKAVTLVRTQDARTNEVMMRNRRIGCSMTGIVQAINKHGRQRFFGWCDAAYRFLLDLDRTHSAALGVPRSIKLTSVKPSGTVSLLAGATPGVHWEHARTYIRRVRLPHGHPLVQLCREAGYPVEPDRYADNSTVISFPIRIANLDRRKGDVPVREKVELAAQLQRHWSDNQVSCTADFDPDTEKEEIPRLLAAYEGRLKAIVFLPARGHGYAQPPYEEIGEDRYAEMVRVLKPLRGDLAHEEQLESRFCEGGTCELP